MDTQGDKGDRGEKGDVGLTGLTGLTGSKGSQCIEDHDLLIRIDQKLDGIVERLKDHEERIRKVEGNMLKVLGVGAITGFIAGWFSKFFNS